MSLFKEGLRLYKRQKLVKHHINKEIYTVSVVFPLFCPAPVYTYAMWVITHVQVMLKVLYIFLCLSVMLGIAVVELLCL
jgi:hypothetical protein